MGNIPPIGGVAWIIGRVKFCELWICGDGFVWFVIANEQKKRLLRVPLCSQPADGFVGNDLCGESFDWTSGDAVSDEVVGISVIRERVVLG